MGLFRSRALATVRSENEVKVREGPFAKVQRPNASDPFFLSFSLSLFLVLSFFLPFSFFLSFSLPLTHSFSSLCLFLSIPVSYYFLCLLLILCLSLSLSVTFSVYYFCLSLTFTVYSCICLLLYLPFPVSIYKFISLSLCYRVFFPFISNSFSVTYIINFLSVSLFDSAAVVRLLFLMLSPSLSFFLSFSLSLSLPPCSREHLYVREKGI
jgi:hypothetical protein